MFTIEYLLYTKLKQGRRVGMGRFDISIIVSYCIVKLNIDIFDISRYLFGGFCLV